MLNVHEVTQHLKEIIQDNSDLVWTRGEISNVKPTRGGTLNFTLTDRDKKIECIIFNELAHLKDTLPLVGSNVSVKGQIYVYDTISEYRFKVTDMPESGGSSINDLMNTLDIIMI